MTTSHWYFAAGGMLLAVVAAVGVWNPKPEALAESSAPTYKVDPFWPKPLPVVKDAQGISRQWVTGEVAATCIDSHEHIVTINRGFLKGGISNTDGKTGIAAPPVIIFDTAGNMVTSWGDPTLTPDGVPKTMPGGFHGCFVDYQDNIWLGGNADGVVQKWSHDGKMLMQIGEKGVCDGNPNTSKGVYSTCGSPGLNQSKTRLNNPADIMVDPNPDPVTGQRGSVYVADGYGNFRVAVFDSAGKYLRQFGSRGNAPGQFGSPEGSGGSGHPHCVVLGNDGLVYTCDRGNNRIQVFDKMGALKRVIPIDPPEHMKTRVSNMAANDMTFSNDAGQTYIFDTDLDSARIWIMNKESGNILGNFGRPGHQAGEFNFPHTIVTDSRGNLYISETVGGRRSQKFVKQ
jgi:hypothetical protein